MPEYVRLLNTVNHIIYSRESNPAPGGPSSCSLAPTCPKHTWLEVSSDPVHLVWLIQVRLIGVIHHISNYMFVFINILWIFGMQLPTPFT